MTVGFIHLQEVSDNESNFLPEAWEIVDSVDSGDSDDENLDIHASKTEENASIDEWTQEESEIVLCNCLSRYS